MELIIGIYKMLRDQLASGDIMPDEAIKFMQEILSEGAVMNITEALGIEKGNENGL